MSQMRRAFVHCNSPILPANVQRKLFRGLENIMMRDPSLYIGNSGRRTVRCLNNRHEEFRTPGHREIDTRRTSMLRINDQAPNFTAETSQGPINFHEWIGNGWAVFVLTSQGFYAGVHHRTGLHGRAAAGFRGEA